MTRLTRDLCSDCWYVVNPTQYFPDADRLGECARCGWRQVIVVRSRIADELVDDGPPRRASAVDYNGQPFRYMDGTSPDEEVRS